MNASDAGPSLERLFTILEPYFPDVELWEERVRRFPSHASGARRLLLGRARTLNLDPRDPFHPHPSLEGLGTDGLHVGMALARQREFVYGDDEIPTGAFLAGSPRSGKTTAVCRLVEEAQRHRIGALVPDARGDYRDLARRVPGALYVPMHELRLNPFEPPEGLHLRRWMQVVGSRLTWDMGLREASAAWAINLLGELVDRCEGRP